MSVVCCLINPHFAEPSKVAVCSFGVLIILFRSWELVKGIRRVLKKPDIEKSKIEATIELTILQEAKDQREIEVEEIEEIEEVGSRESIRVYLMSWLSLYCHPPKKK